jgi:hypothetical protein
MEPEEVDATAMLPLDVSVCQRLARAQVARGFAPGYVAAMTYRTPFRAHRRGKHMADSRRSARGVTGTFGGGGRVAPAGPRTSARLFA